jgi:hypothetical protein
MRQNHAWEMGGGECGEGRHAGMLPSLPFPKNVSDRLIREKAQEATLDLYTKNIYFKIFFVTL